MWEFVKRFLLRTGIYRSTLRLLVIGLPNAGKSTLEQRLTTGLKSEEEGPTQPTLTVTKSSSSLRSDNLILEVTDTPGDSTGKTAHQCSESRVYNATIVIVDGTVLSKAGLEEGGTVQDEEMGSPSQPPMTRSMTRAKISADEYVLAVRGLLDQALARGSLVALAINKCDKEIPIHAWHMHLERARYLNNHSIRVFDISALKGTNVELMVEWIVSQMAME